MIEISSPATLSALWEEVRLPERPPLPLVRHAQVEAWVRRLPPDLFQVEVAGHSVEGRALYHVQVGQGPRQVLLWSQMHGDEPTATTALFEVFEYVRRYREHPRVQELLSTLTLHAVPMLNPDGAERFQRVNAQGIDINRDALRLQTPEGRTLKALRDRLQPSIGFNLHNQDWRTSVGTSGKPASISLLAPAFDAARSDNPGRLLAKKLCAVIRDAVEALVPGQVGRYSDAFEVRAFGDNMGLWGTPAVLIETGPWAGIDADAPLLRLNFVALVSSLEALASGQAEQADLGRYDSIPLNDGKGLFHVVVKEAHVFGEAGEAFIGDIGMTAFMAVRQRQGAPVAVIAGQIADLGDLRVFGAVETVDGRGLTAVPLPPRGAREGDLIPLPPRSLCGVKVGQPAELMLLRPAKSAGMWRVERIVRFER
ncbi:M14 family metallopeptidase [Hyalangium rubrum]|uniref:M14 metallopeptidase family protein n=1 Tax=Hyalangium rubrum TaxID=3103134 RepID=A0ABU5HDX1_9BACT|nr:M14 metallopeptidase family protein [Hyalangium sp. s54d21]MDY7231664.1 M14 metallopeptidase family protein [Hyalangium sp. s54d21]